MNLIRFLRGSFLSAIWSFHQWLNTNIYILFDMLGYISLNIIYYISLNRITRTIRDSKYLIEFFTWHYLNIIYRGLNINLSNKSNELYWQLQHRFSFNFSQLILVMSTLTTHIFIGEFDLPAKMNVVSVLITKFSRQD